MCSMSHNFVACKYQYYIIFKYLQEINRLVSENPAHIFSAKMSVFCIQYQKTSDLVNYHCHFEDQVLIRAPDKKGFLE